MKSLNDYIVNIQILKNNALNIKKHIGNTCKFCAVVKANAYGVGLETVCRSLYGIADFFACACLKEALSIRLFDKVTPILILGHVTNDSLNVVAENNISISIGDLESLKSISSIVKKRINIHLQINTGLNRFGVRTLTDFAKALKIIKNNDLICLEGVYTHFATKNNDVTFINKQFLRFMQFKNLVVDKNVIFHTSNSFATLHFKKYHLNMVRNGFLLYGYTKNNIDNKPVVRIISHVMSVMKVKKGDTIGYDRTYKAKKQMKIAIVPLGYADGYNRLLSNKGKVLIGGKFYSIVGLICMDVFMVDITNNNVKVGDKVIILGESGGKNISLYDMSEEVGTSPYEILCNFNSKRMNYIKID